MKIRNLVRAALLAVLPTGLARLLVNRMGYSIARGARVGFSLVLVRRLEMAPHSYIGHLNVLKGPVEIVIAEHAGFGHSNTVLGSAGFPGRPHAVLRFGTWSKITHGHHVDLTDSITIGNYTTFAGAGSQLWTHGYIHEMDGLDRYRIDGPIVIGDNCYIGTGAIISMGVTLGKGVIVGAGASVAKDLLEPGLYVPSTLRQLPRPAAPETRGDLERMPEHPSGDIVYRKRKR